MKNDLYICPEGQTLTYSTTDRDGYRHYKSNPEHCQNCPLLSTCTQNKKYQKTTTRHIWEEDKEQVRKNRLSNEGKWIYRMRKEKVERSFADSKRTSWAALLSFAWITKCKRASTINGSLSEHEEDCPPSSR